MPLRHDQESRRHCQNCSCGTTVWTTAPVVEDDGRVNKHVQARPAQQGHRPPGNLLQLRSLHGLPNKQDHGNRPLHHDREIDDLRRKATAGPPQFSASENCNCETSRRMMVLLVHTDQDAEHPSPADDQRELSVRCIVTSKTSPENTTAVIDTSATLKNPISCTLHGKHGEQDENRTQDPGNHVEK